jgi:hypothetical protein
VREKAIETYLVKRVKEWGGKAFKFTSPGHRGVPDRIVCLPCRLFFVELKRPGGKLRPDQVAFHTLMERLRVPCFVVDTKAKVDALHTGVDTSWRKWVPPNAAERAAIEAMGL